MRGGGGGWRGREEREEGDRKRRGWRGGWRGGGRQKRRHKELCLPLSLQPGIYARGSKRFHM